MRYRVKDYQIALPGGDVQKIGLTNLSGITIEDIRLIVNETKNKIICSSMKKSNVTVSDTVGGFSAIDVPKAVCILAATDVLTIEIDKGDVPVQGASQASVDAIAQRLDVADAYSVTEYPVADCTTMAQNHCKAVYGEVADEQTPDRYKVRARVLFTTAPNASPITGTEMNLKRNLAYGLSRKAITLQHNGVNYTTDIPDTGYGFHELWRKEGNAWKHYVKNPAAGSTDGNIDTLKPTLESVSGGVVTYNDIICLTDPSTIN